jgi:DNA-binding transcriptional ArsR family regulator
MDKNIANTARMFRALSVEKRVEIVQLLAKRSLCVGALSNITGISPGAVSQHMRVLRDAGLVEADRRGYFVHYHLAPDADKLCGSVVKHLFEIGKGEKPCVAKRTNARIRKNSKASRKRAQKSR